MLATIINLILILNFVNGDNIYNFTEIKYENDFNFNFVRLQWEHEFVNITKEPNYFKYNLFNNKNYTEINGTFNNYITLNDNNISNELYTFTGYIYGLNPYTNYTIAIGHEHNDLINELNFITDVYNPPPTSIPNFNYPYLYFNETNNLNGEIWLYLIQIFNTNGLRINLYYYEYPNDGFIDISDNITDDNTYYYFRISSFTNEHFLSTTNMTKLYYVNKSLYITTTSTTSITSTTSSNNIYNTTITAPVLIQDENDSSIDMDKLKIGIISTVTIITAIILTYSFIRLHRNRINQKNMTIENNSNINIIYKTTKIKKNRIIQNELYNTTGINEPYNEYDYGNNNYYDDISNSTIPEYTEINNDNESTI